MTTTSSAPRRTRSLRRAGVFLTALGLALTSLTATLPAHAEIREEFSPTPTQLCDFDWKGQPFVGCISATSEVVDITSGATVENGGKVRPGDILETRWTFTNDTDQTFAIGDLGFETIPQLYTCGEEKCEYGPEVPNTGAYRNYGLVFDSLHLDVPYHLFPGIGSTPDGSSTWLSADALPLVAPSQEISVFVRHQVPLNAPHDTRAPHGGVLTFTDPPNRPGSTGFLRTGASTAAYVDAIAPVVTVPEGPVFPDHTFTGTAEPDATITLTPTDTRATNICTTTADDTGAWACTPTTPLPISTTALTVTSVSASDGYTTTTSATVNVIPAPAADVSSTLHLSTVNGKPATTGQTASPGDRLGYTITTTNTGTAPGTTTLTAALPVDSTNVSPDGNWNCTPNGTSCTTSVTTPAGGTTTIPLTFTLGTTTSDTAAITLTTNAGTCEQCTITTLITASDPNEPGDGNGKTPGTGTTTAGTGNLAATGTDAPVALTATALAILGAGLWLLTRHRTRHRQHTTP